MDENSNDMATPQEPIPAQPSESIAPAAPLPATVTSAEKGNGVRNYVLAGASAVVGAVLVLGAGAIGYTIGNHDSDDYREATMSLSGDRNGQQGESEDEAYGNRDGNDPMMQGGGIQDFLNELNSGRGLTPDQQQFLDQLKGFVGGMRNQMS